ncbi:MAG: MFS transporter [Bacteroidales bacterium]|nr:MFS transporter [Bacteroidales bacterium]
MNWTKKQISILSIVAITSFMGTFLISSINIALPAIEKSFRLNAIELSWVVTSFLLSTAIFLLPVGRWGDLSGIRKLFKIGVVIFSLSSLICGLAGSGFWLIIFRFIQGIGAAFTSTTGPAILVSSFLPKYRGRVLGMSVAAVYLGLAFGPFVGGFLTQYLGWRSIFLISAVLGMLTATIAFIFLGKDQTVDNINKKIHLKGTLFYIIGLICLVYGSANIPAAWAWIGMTVGALFLVLFWFVETRSSAPVIDTKLFSQNRLFAYSNIAALINYSATFAIVFLLSLFLQKVKGLNPRDAGLVLVAQPIIMAVFSPLAGRLSDKIQARYLTTAGMAMCSIGLVAFYFVGETTPISFIVTNLIWLGLGFALFSSPNMNTIMGSVPKTAYGQASGTAATMRVLGQIVSMTIVSLFFAALFGHTAMKYVDNDIFVKAIHWAFASFATISFVGIYFSYKRGKLQKESVLN